MGLQQDLKGSDRESLPAAGVRATKTGKCGMGGIKVDLRSILPKPNPAVASRFKIWQRKLETELANENKAVARLQEQWSEK